MATIFDIDTAETDEECILGYQAGINSGQIWLLEGATGRQAMTLIKDGLCILGVESHRDYWGNLVPSRTQVVAGTLGSVEYATASQGDEWVARLLEVK